MGDDPFAVYDNLIRAHPEVSSKDAPNVKLEHRLIHLQWGEAREFALRSAVIDSVLRDFESTLLAHAAPNGRLTEERTVWGHARAFVACFHLMILDATARTASASTPRDEDCCMSNVWSAIGSQG
ncbi:hypothetical protein CYMTET_4547 [Cymbomonas tetramitiformis]|uniref:Uncharacterized protein n=1 Tax=Cymbomonas tetramitiformis TaxID=36881 RepID=A0AAE0EWC9_9CHLO|nr:hypothetical protein CYMTET_47223 [Cymbomonas tetramitiformis]KAK3287993.1 hypothetical protein CYMTET_4547 [Cymbomonas tetramitiformis]